MDVPQYQILDDFYPRSPCGERRSAWVQEFPELYISIHALLAESDLLSLPFRAVRIDFYPRSPCGERRALATYWTRTVYFYPRSPCGERHLTNYHFTLLFIFLSTLSLRRATAKVHKTVGHFCAYETNFMGIASSC